MNIIEVLKEIFEYITTGKELVKELQAENKKLNLFNAKLIDKNNKLTAKLTEIEGGLLKIKEAMPK